MPVLALGAVDLIALLIALAALLVLGAMWVFAAPIQAVLGRVPVVGGYLGTSFTDGLEAVMRSVVYTYDRMSHAVGHFFWALAVGWWHLLYQNVQTLVHLGEQIGGVATRLGQLFAQAVADAEYLASVAYNTALSLFAQAVALAETLYGDAISIVQQYYNQAIAYAGGIFWDALNVMNQVEASILATVAADVGFLEHAITSAADDVRSEAVTLFGQAEAAVAGLAGQVAADVQALTSDISGIETQLGPLVGALPLLGAIPLLQSAVAAVTTEVDTCLTPMCDTVTPRAPQLGRLGQFLQGLETLGVDALVAGLFTEAIVNPGGLARDTITLVEDVGDPVVAGIRDLTGL